MLPGIDSTGCRLNTRVCVTLPPNPGLFRGFGVRHLLESEAVLGIEVDAGSLI